MTGFERLKKQMEGQKDPALKQTVEYLLSRDDMEEKYLNEEKNIEEMAKYIRAKGQKHCSNGWNYITNEVVYAWAIMYFSFPNTFLKINTKPKENTTKSAKTSTANKNKNNIISLEDAKKQIGEKKEVAQISLFGGEV